MDRTRLISRAMTRAAFRMSVAVENGDMTLADSRAKYGRLMVARDKRVAGIQTAEFMRRAGVR